MRLPLAQGSETEVDRKESIRLIREGIDRGINYIDTAYPYHNGESEIITGEALKDGYRDRAYLATKLPSWLVKTRADMDNLLDEQLKKLGTDHIDMYLLHALNTDLWENLQKHEVFDFIEKAKASGRIKHIGFSFHDELPLFKTIVDAYDWEFCQIQYNLMDVDYQAGRSGLEYAAKKDLGIVIMEPLRGGSLVRNIPDDINSLWKSSATLKSPVEAAFRFAWNHPGVGTVLSGMNSQQQLDENLEAADNSMPESLTEEESALLKTIRKEYRDRIAADCTNCKYCMPCPSGVDIPANLGFLNNVSMYGNLEPFKTGYTRFFAEEKKAHNCTECGSCEPSCPQKIEIIRHLKELDKIMNPA